MSIFSKLRERRDIELLAEEKVYEHVSKEIAAGNIREGLWAKASAIADSSEEADVSRKYIQLRVEMICAEERVFGQFMEEVEQTAEDLYEEDDEEESSNGRVFTFIVFVALLVWWVANEMGKNPY